MDKEIKELYEKFLIIKSKGFIKSIRRETSGVGYTFEKLIGKVEESFPIPDYKGIEIKTSRRTSWGKIHLFHATPDGDYLFPIKTILEVLGYPDKDYPEYNVFNYNVNAKYFTNVGFNKKVKINVDRKNEKICLTASDKFNNHLDLPISWSFEMLKKNILKA